MIVEIDVETPEQREEELSFADLVEGTMYTDNDGALLVVGEGRDIGDKQLIYLTGCDGSFPIFGDTPEFGPFKKAVEGTKVTLTAEPYM